LAERNEAKSAKRSFPPKTRILDILLKASLSAFSFATLSKF
jgi:hypothetical protein